MRPKGKLLALFTIFVAIGIVTATGAFTSVSATRTAEVNVAGDSAALLQLQPHPGPNGYNPGDGGSQTNSEGYAQLTDGELEINLLGDFDDDGIIGSGVNNNATTDIQGVFNITNQGSQAVYVNVSDMGSTTNDPVVTFYNASFADHSSDGLETDNGQSGSAVKLDPGETLTVSIYIDTESTNVANSAELVNEVQLYAASDGTVFNSTNSGPGG